MITVLVAMDTVYKQMVAISLRKEGNRDPSQVAVWPHSHDTSDIPKVIIQGDSEPALVQSLTMHVHC